MKKTFAIALVLLSLVFNCALVSQDEVLLVDPSLDAPTVASASQEEFLPTDHSIEAFSASKKYTIEATRDDVLANEKLYPKKHNPRVLIIGKRPEKYEVGKPFSHIELQNYLEENILEGDWGGCDGALSFEYGETIVHIYIINKEAVEKVINAYSGQKCAIMKHYTGFSITEQKALTKKLENGIGLLIGDELSASVAYYTYEQRSKRFEDPFIYLMVSTDYPDYYTEQIHKLLIDNNAGDKVIVHYWYFSMPNSENVDT